MNIDAFNQSRQQERTSLELKMRKKEEWIQVETWRKIETRRGVILKQRIHSTQSERVRDQLRRKYSELYEVKNITNLDKRKFVERLAEEAEEFAGK